MTTRTTSGSATYTLTVSAAGGGWEVSVADIRVGELWSEPVQRVPLRNGLGGGRQWAAGGPLPDGVHRVYPTLRRPRHSHPVSLDYLVSTAFPPPPSLTC